MATTYPVQNPGHPGQQIAYTSPVATGDVATCGSGYALIIVNPAANGTVTVSLPPQGGLADGLTVNPRVVSITQGTTWLIPLPVSVHGPSAVLTYTGALTTVQAAVINPTT